MTVKQPKRPFWRQGDIFFVQLESEPNLKDASQVPSGVIAHGEETGHTHRLSSASMEAGAELALWDGSMYLRCAAGATIVHDEHGPLQLPAGVYAVVNQREFDGLAWHTVRD